MERPESVRRLRRWADALTPDDHDGPGHVSVVSFRVLPERPTRCSIYLRPHGYAQRGRAARGPGERPVQQQSDPSRV
jgi:hypothetical protein